MQEKLLLISEKLNSIVYSKYLTFEDVVSLKNVTGVYFIYDQKDELLYIGNTNKFHIRFGTDLKHESTHTFVRKLIKRKLFSDRHEVVAFLKSKCKFKVSICVTKREAEALEGLCIYILGPVYNK